MSTARVLPVFLLVVACVGLGACGATNTCPPAAAAPSQDGSTSAAQAVGQLDGQTLLVRYSEKKAELEAMAERITSEPWPFPEKADPELVPEYLLPRLKRATVEKGLEVEFLEPDCSEYPCIYVGKMPRPGKTSEVWDAPAVVDLKMGRNTLTGEHRVQACWQWVFMAAAYSTHVAPDLLSKRIQARFAEIKETICPPKDS